MEAEPAATEGETAIARGTTRTLDVTVLMGGPSTEREVSLVSGAAVADALARVGHRVTRADISPSDTSALDAPGIDVVFIALHGDFGESGEVQALCEARSLRYIGSGPRASELCMDKAASKQLVRRAGVKTPDWTLVEDFDPPEDAARRVRELSLPAMLKPVDGGSSVDVTIARDAAARDKALAALVDKYGRAMVERFMPGRELTVGILGDRALPVLEIVPDGAFYDFRAKYSDAAATRYVFDHGLPESVCAAVQRAAMESHRALGCRDLSRVDFILDASGAPWFLEINTIPGFTSHSLLPKAAARVGIGFDALCDRLLAMAMAR
ncbi:MAG TPA: D-alanine--D-alanine ligase [Phycisphaerales bacterium]|nr:D-alanine--D-alanine ligase [Phycisphaerales bacterium]